MRHLKIKVKWNRPKHWQLHLIIARVLQVVGYASSFLSIAYQNSKTVKCFAVPWTVMEFDHAKVVDQWSATAVPKITRCIQGHTSEIMKESTACSSFVVSHLDVVLKNINILS
jgi:hypothetical protein